MNFHFNGSLRFIHRLFPKQVSLQKGATHSEPVVEGPLGGEDIQVPELSGCVWFEDVWRFWKRWRLLDFQKYVKVWNKFYVNEDIWYLYYYILKSIQINYNPNVYVSAPQVSSHFFDSVCANLEGCFPIWSLSKKTTCHTSCRCGICQHATGLPNLLGSLPFPWLKIGGPEVLYLEVHESHQKHNAEKRRKPRGFSKILRKFWFESWEVFFWYLQACLCCR